MTTNRSEGTDEHDFALLLYGVPELTQDVEDRLFEAGCDDATLGIQNGQSVLTFTRSAPSLKAAIFSAIRDVRAAGVGVLRVDDCNLVNQADIARRMGRTRQMVNQYIRGTRGPGSFPPPVCHITDGAPLWPWCEVAHWLCEHDLIPKNQDDEAQLIATVNNTLETLHQRRRDAALVEEVFNAVSGPQVPQPA